MSDIFSYLSAFLLLSFIMSFNHPMMILVLVILLAMMISMKIFIFSSNSWFPLLVMLIFVGGMMIMFIFTISITPNKIFMKPKISKTLIWVPAVFLIFNNHMSIEKTSSELMLFSWKSISFIMMLFFFMMYIFMFYLYMPNKTMKKIT